MTSKFIEEMKRVGKSKNSTITIKTDDGVVEVKGREAQIFALGALCAGASFDGVEMCEVKLDD